MAITPKGIKYPNNYSEVADIPEVMKEMAQSIDTAIENSEAGIDEEIQTLQTRITNKVDKISGKGLSTNDFTNAYKEKLDIITNEKINSWDNKQEQLIAGENITIENNVISATGGGSGEETDPIFTNSPAYGIVSQDITNWNNKSNFSGSYNDLTNKPIIPSKTSDLQNDSNFAIDANYIHTDNNYTSTEKTKLSGIAMGAQVNVQANWTEIDSSSDSFIQNKPIIPTITIRDWGE